MFWCCYRTCILERTAQAAMLQWHYALTGASQLCRTLMIFLTCSGGMSSFAGSTYPNFRLSPYRLEFSCCHFRACVQQSR